MEIKNYSEAILASMLVADIQERNKNIQLILNELTEDKFEEVNHKLVYHAILDCYQDEREVDLLNVANALGKNLDKIGGMQELRWIKDTLTRLELYSTKGLPQWATIVDKAGRIRQIHLVLREQADYLGDFSKAFVEIENVDEYLSDLISRLHREQGGIKHGYQPMRLLIDDWRERFNLQCQGNIVGRVLTGWKTWDSKIIGLPQGEVTVLAGLSGMGKTQLALQLGYNIAARSQEGSVIMNSLEMSSNKLIERLACCHGRVDSRKVQSGQLTQSEISKIGDEADKLQRIPFYIDAESRTSGEISLQAYAASVDNKKKPVKLLIIDYAEMVQDQRTDSEELRVSGIYREAKNIANKLNTAVLIISQYNRGVSMRNDKIGTKSDLRYSGMAENVAGLIIHIYNPWQLNLDHPGSVQPPPELPIVDNRAYLLSDKNRDGATGHWAMNWEPAYTRWSDISETAYMGRQADF